MDKEINDWKPIECNAEVFNEFSQKLGYPLTDLRWFDVIGLEEENWY